EELLEVAQRAVRGVDAGVLGDVVAIVLQRRRVERQDPDGRDAEVLQVVEAPRETLEVADAVVVAVLEGADVRLVDNCVPVPLGIASERDGPTVAGRRCHQVGSVPSCRRALRTSNTCAGTDDGSSATKLWGPCQSY